jgi:hypothetical protein
VRLQLRVQALQLGADEVQPLLHVARRLREVLRWENVGSENPGA